MTAYLFDIDGVLTDPVEKQVTEPELLDYIFTFLSRGDPVALNTGRSVEWIEERVLPHLFAKAEDKDLLTKFIIIGEKGETWMVWDEKGEARQETTEGLEMPEELREKFRELVEKHYHDAMFFDSTKTVMITAEMRDSYNIQQFQQHKNKFIEALQDLLRSLGLENTYSIHRDDISVSIEHKHVGKALGAKRFLTFLKERGLKPEQFYCFGDTTTDIEMADELAQRGKDVTFVYTGDKTKVGDVKKEYPFIFSEGYTQGTLRYLKNLEKVSVENRN